MKFNIRNLIAWLYAWYIHWKGDFRKINRLSSAGKIIHSVYFHNPSRKLFEGSVKWFLKRGYTFVSTETLYNIIQSKKPFPPKTVIFTIDDGWKENVENVVAVANAYQIPVTIFISTKMAEEGCRFWWSAVEHALGKEKVNVSFFHELKALPDEERRQKVDEITNGHKKVREAMEISQIKEIIQSPFIHIGSHTHTHPILTKCTDQRLQEEIEWSTEKLKDWTGQKIVDFAYPNGSYSSREIDMLTSFGYRMAFNTKPGFIQHDNSVNIFAIPRFDVLEDVSYRENICRMNGAWFLHKTKEKINTWE